MKMSRRWRKLCEICRSGLGAAPTSQTAGETRSSSGEIWSGARQSSTVSTVSLLLRFFYRGCNYSTEVFRAKYDLFYTVRSLAPEWFDDWDPTDEGVRKVLETGAFLPLRGYDKKGRFVMIVRQRFLDPAVITVDELYKTFLILFSVAMEENNQVSSSLYLSDTE